MRSCARQPPISRRRWIGSSRFRFISAHRATFGVKRLCRVLAVSRSGFYRWSASEPAPQARAAAEDALAEQVRAIHADSGGTYGSPRVTVELHEQGVRVNRKRVERIMRQRDVVGRHLRRRKQTTVPDPAVPPAPDLIDRDFTATAPDQRWCGDITYLRVGTSWLRRVIGRADDLFLSRTLANPWADPRAPWWEQRL